MLLTAPALEMRNITDIHIALATQKRLLFLLLCTLRLVCLKLIQVAPLFLITHASWPANGSLGHYPIVVLFDMQIKGRGARVIPATAAPKYPLSWEN